jgi:hypothetical protein
MSIDRVQVSKFYLKTETESSLRNIVLCDRKRTVFLHKYRTMDNVHKHNINTNSYIKEIPDRSVNQQFVYY